MEHDPDVQFLIDNFSADEITNMSAAIYKSITEMHNEEKINEKVHNAIQDGVLAVWTELMTIKYSEEKE